MTTTLQKLSNGNVEISRDNTVTSISPTSKLIMNQENKIYIIDTTGETTFLDEVPTLKDSSGNTITAATMPLVYASLRDTFFFLN